MAPEHYLIYSACVSVAISIGAAFFAARFGVKSALKGKWWDKKEKAYTDVIDALYLGLRYNEEAEEAMYNPDVDTGESWNRSKTAYLAIEKASTIGEFHLSREASALLRAFTTRKKPIHKYGADDNRDECIHEAIKAHKETLEKFRQIALRDLEVR